MAKKKTEDKSPLYLAIGLCAVACVVLFAVLNPFGRGSGNDTNDETEGCTETNVVQTDGSHAPVFSDSTDVTDAVGSDVPGGTGAATDDAGSSMDSGVDPSASSPSGISVEIKTSSSNEGNGHITMLYPSVSGDTIDASSITKLIRGKMDAERDEALIGTGNSEFTYTVEDVQMKLCTETFLSMVVTGYSYIGDASHPNLFVYTINCDLRSGRIMTNEELVSDFTKVKSAFTSGKFTLVHGADGLLSETSYEDMILEYRAEYGIYPPVYYTGSKFGIAVELVYSLGGYATFEISQSSLSGAIYVPN